MKNPRVYGEPPYHVAVLHGGPGALGEMSPVALELAQHRGVLEPFQTAGSLEGLLEELRLILGKSASAPVALVGYSWGAWLGLLLAARHPELVGKLILVSSGPLDPHYAPQVLQNRLKRLSAGERKEAKALQKDLRAPDHFTRFGELMAKADFYDPLPLETEGMELRPDLYQRIWDEAGALRKSGRLLQQAQRLQCPVVAIHGDHDPHPAEGVEKPLSRILADFRFILLEKCGHKPWMEKQARALFFNVLTEETR